jgi:DNA-binding XRE family transcriptional regulator
MMGRKSRFESASLQHLYERYVGDDKAKADALEAEREIADIARKIYGLRSSAGLTQGELAKRVGTSPSVISRLEDADYAGHSLAMLRRVAAALNVRVEIQFLPIEEPVQST